MKNSFTICYYFKALRTSLHILIFIYFSLAVHHRPFVQDFNCEGDAGGTIISNASTARSAPVFSLQYGSSYKKFLAAADEDGYVSVINTGRSLPAGLDDDVSRSRPVAQWTAHKNAVFDLSWANRDRWIYTASGDMSLCLWDTSYAYKITSFFGHSGSVRSLSVSPHAAEIVASGSCDGNLLIWDARVQATCTGASHGNGATSHRHSVLRLFSPHPRSDAASLNPLSRSFFNSSVLPTVTAVKFLGKGTGHTLVSGGLDGIVKFWDLRYTVAPQLTVSLPEDDVHASMSKSIQRTNRNARLVHLADTPQQTLGKRTYAVTSLAVRPDSSQLLVSLKGGHHVMYDVDRPEVGPVKWYGGHTVSSFYVKTSFSPDGSHFASGSSDDKVCIWQVDDDSDGGCAPYTLPGHTSEVTAVAWCPTDFCQLATTADDYTIKVWNISRKQEEEKQDTPGGWVPQPRAEILLAAKPKNFALSTARGDEQLVVGGENNNNTNRMMIDSRENNNNNNNNHQLDQIEAASVTPLGAAAVNSSRLATTTAAATTALHASRGAPASTGQRIRIANALRLSLMNKPRMKRTKQQTLAEALNAARASQAAREDGDGVDAGESGASKQQQRRPRSAGTSDEEEDASQRSQQNNTAAAAVTAGAGAGAGGCSNNTSPSLDENQPMNI